MLVFQISFINTYRPNANKCPLGDNTSRPNRKGEAELFSLCAHPLAGTAPNKSVGASR
jgi:hypothetical protein